eukprot:2923480-Lingulodinium_polyedra.AAC.1
MPRKIHVDKSGTCSYGCIHVRQRARTLACTRAEAACTASQGTRARSQPGQAGERAVRASAGSRTLAHSCVRA